MTPPLSILRVGRSLVVRTKPSSITSRQPLQFISVSRRGYAEDKGPKGPNQDVLGHVSEEAAAMADITGETKPDLSQGTPVQEIFERDEKAREKAPEVIKEDLDKKKASKEAEGFSEGSTAETSSLENPSDELPSDENLTALRQMAHISEGGFLKWMGSVGHKFGIPELPIPPRSNLKYRYDPLVSQVTRLLMKDGKLSKAQREMAFILNHLRSSPAPKTDPSRPLVPDAPPPTHLPLNPVLYLGVAIDSIAPLLKIKSLRGMAGGGASLPIPVPLGLRQRRRQAFTWILDSANRKTSRGSGKYQFAQKVAEEIISVVEGRSSAWEKRHALHRLGTTNRANLNIVSSKRKR